MGISISIGLTQNSQSVEGNYSSVTATVYYSKTASTYNNNQKPLTIVLDGQTYNLTSSFPKGTTSGTLGSVTKTVYHDSNGAKTVYASATFVSGVNSGTVTASASKVLSTIARATVPTLSVSSAALGDSITVNLPRKSSSFTHTVSYSIGSASGTIATGAGASCTWTIPESLAAQIASSTAGTITISVTTYNGSTAIGTKTINLSVSVPDTEEYNPTLSLAVEDAAGYKDKYGYYLVGYSKYKVIATEKTMYGATVKSRLTTMNGASYNTKDPTSGVLLAVENNSVECTITDSRNRSVTASVTNLPTRAYTLPQFLEITPPVRCLANGTPYEDGDYIKAKMTFSYDSIGGKNTATAKIKARPRTSEEYTTEATVQSGQEVILVGDHNYTYYVTYEITDSLGSTITYTYQLNTHDAVISSKLGYKLAIGKAAELGTPEKPVFESAWHTVLPSVESESETTKALAVGDIDYTITSDEYDELLNLLGGGTETN